MANDLKLSMTRAEMVHDGVGRLWVALNVAGRKEEAAALHRLWHDEMLLELASADDLFDKSSLFEARTPFLEQSPQAIETPQVAPARSRSTMIYEPMSDASYVEAALADELWGQYEAALAAEPDEALDDAVDYHIEMLEAGYILNDNDEYVDPDDEVEEWEAEEWEAENPEYEDDEDDEDVGYHYSGELDYEKPCLTWEEHQEWLDHQEWLEQQNELTSQEQHSNGAIPF